MKTENMLQMGNHKLPATTGIFNLPRIKTCPGRTSDCMRYCYAAKAERMYKTAAAYRERMLELTIAQEFVQSMIDYIKSKKVVVKTTPVQGLTITPPLRVPLSTVRIHESGDAYSQEYLNKWLEIATALPLVTFYMYTKSFMLDFSKRPKNLIVRGSIDPSSKQLEIDAAMKLDGVAETRYGKQAAIVPDAKECPGSCKTCDYCLKPGNVWFKLH
jgi:Gene product 88